MIPIEKVNIDWLTQVSAKNNKADKILVEKVIRALLLLEGLAQTKIPFVFKGGTALMLILGSTKRLSIDIDIVIQDKLKSEEAFSKITKDKGFTRFELQERSINSNIEKGPL
jgi:predicted nucleotidyltransferase component of viral defense system